MDKLSWFKFKITDWVMGKIMKCPEVTQARFIRLCCLYWNKECVLSIEDAEIEIDLEHLDILFNKKIVVRNNGFISIKFLDGQMIGVADISEKRTKSVNKRWEKHKKNNTSVLQSYTNVIQSDTEERREEKSKEEYISGVETPPIDFGKFISFFNSFANRSFKISDKVKKALNARLKDYTKIQVQQAVTNAHLDQYHIDTNFKYLTPEFILRPDKLDKFLNAPTTTQTINYNPYTRGAAN